MILRFYDSILIIHCISLNILLTADDCISEPCLDGATCTDALGTFICTCAVGWEGIQCEIGTMVLCIVHIL